MSEPKQIQGQQVGPIGASVIGAVFMLFGVWLAFFYGKEDLRLGKESENWPTVSGTVTHSDVRASGTGSDQTFKAVVKYKYSVDGKGYTSDRISFRIAGIKFKTRALANAFLNEYDRGESVTVHYDTEDPKTACLKPGRKGAWIGLVGFALIALGVAIDATALVTLVKSGLR